MIKYITTIDGKEYEVELRENGQVCVNGEEYDVDFEEVSGQRIYTILVSGRSFEVHVSEDEGHWNVMMQGSLYKADVIDEREKRLQAAGGEAAAGAGDYILKSPMPGLVVSIAVSEGQKVAKGDVLVILESMKMQNELKSPQDGAVSQIPIKEGDSVEQKEVLVVLDPIPEE